ncbi:proline-rich receptor-like protein kinase PERK2 [Zingiber officinale]|uniref:proline-rich receptor-like protein kinase PERK2 n=1 Tax=Zingiber officinale TaxID=94328 RepID=UPI001C4D6128|nr:proline-rich receptor-like protein kinase PERK2 [Zingiber officinale]
MHARRGCFVEFTPPPTASSSLPSPRRRRSRPSAATSPSLFFLLSPFAGADTVASLLFFPGTLLLQPTPPSRQLLLPPHASRRSRRLPPAFAYAPLLFTALPPSRQLLLPPHASRRRLSSPEPMPAANPLPFLFATPQLLSLTLTSSPAPRTASGCFPPRQPPATARPLLLPHQDAASYDSSSSPLDVDACHSSASFSSPSPCLAPLYTAANLFSSRRHQSPCRQQPPAAPTPSLPRCHDQRGGQQPSFLSPADDARLAPLPALYTPVHIHLRRADAINLSVL